VCADSAKQSWAFSLPHAPEAVSAIIIASDEFLSVGQPERPLKEIDSINDGRLIRHGAECLGIGQPERPQVQPLGFGIGQTWERSGHAGRMMAWFSYSAEQAGDGPALSALGREQIAAGCPISSNVRTLVAKSPGFP